MMAALSFAANLAASAVFVAICAAPWIAAAIYCLRDDRG